MSQALAKWARHQRRNERADSRPVRPVEERRSLQLMRREAKLAASLLASAGKGGLPSSLVLGVMRRDQYTCKVCGQKGNPDNGGIGVHHKGGIVESRWLSQKGHANEPNNLVTICDRCHDRIHRRAKAEGVDSSQVEPIGDQE